MNLLSEHNRILRVGEGGGGIEYSAGPNIDITNHVISGRDWSDDIDDAVMSGISSTSGDIVNEAYNQSTAWVDEQSYLTAHQDISNLPYVQNSALESNGILISGISGSGFFAESANNSYHSDDSFHADYADSADSASYADSAGYTELADSAHVADYAAIAESAYGLVNGYSGIAPIVVDNEHMLISAQSAVLGVQDPLYFVEDTSASTVIGIHDSAFPTFEGTPEGKISAINGSALNADPIIPYSGGSNIDIDNYIISVTGSVQSADRASYAVSATSSHYSHSAIEAASANSATYDSLGREITATYLTAVTGDNTPYSAGANISINDHVVSGKDWTSEIQAASANAVAQIPTGLMVTSGLEYDSDNHYITAYNGSAIGKEETEYSAGPNIVINNHIIGLDSAVELTNITGNRGAILDPSGLYVSNLNQSDYTEIGLDHVLSTDGSASIGWQLGNKAISIGDNSGNGDYRNLLLDLNDVYLEERHPEPTPDKVYSLTGACTSAISAINMINSGDSQAYSAGANIDITDHVISGKDWGTEISAASSYAYEQATAHGGGGTGDYVANSALNINDNYITGISSYGIGHPQVPVSGESGIYLTKNNGTVFIGYSGIPTLTVATSAQATGTNILYIVTGS